MKLTSAATVSVMQDIIVGIRHDGDALGFDVTFEYGEPTFCAGLCRDDVEPPRDYPCGTRAFT